MVDSDQSTNPPISAKVSADGVVSLSGVQPDEEISVLNDTPPTEPLVSWRKEEMDEHRGMVDGRKSFDHLDFVQSCEWKMASLETSFLDNRVMFHFHDSRRKVKILEPLRTITNHYLSIVGGYQPPIGCRIIRCPCWLDSSICFFLGKHINCPKLFT